eukprot:NODE_23666_length_656_cov_4.155009.p1 GENE.NODE_23666_length_656_cov_4.155009~~NODE_23666_length_656_cov_4.155009.p1  ORF type:complete len:194 (+),score=65.24 NODE_23666_length_656_cov_4.155009:3-584(+)
MRSEALNVSAGIPLVESRVIFRGISGRLYAHTKMDGFEHCWAVDTTSALPFNVNNAGGVARNPFTRMKFAGDGFSVPGGGGSASKYVLYIGVRKRIELFAEKSRLLAINADDLEDDATSGILVRDYSTAEIDASWFEPGHDWHCEEAAGAGGYAVPLADWDLLQVFFPYDTELPAAAGLPERRLPGSDDVELV